MLTECFCTPFFIEHKVEFCIIHIRRKDEGKERV